MFYVKGRVEKAEEDFTSNHLAVLSPSLTGSAYCGCFCNALRWECQLHFGAVRCWKSLSGSAVEAFTINRL